LQIRLKLQNRDYSVIRSEVSSGLNSGTYISKIDIQPVNIAKAFYHQWKKTLSCAIINLRIKMKKILFILLSAALCSLCFAQKIEVAGISASSTLSSSSNLYKVENLTDGKADSWVEGQPDSGIGTKITIRFKTDVSLKTFYIKNGYGDFRHFYANNRVKTLNWSFSRRGGGSIHLEDTPGFQKIEFDFPVKTNCLILEIAEIYKGEKYDDTAIAEISFDDWEKLNHEEMNRSIIWNRIDDLFECYKEKDAQITDKKTASAFSHTRSDNRHGEDWFLVSCRNDMIPLTNGCMYIVSSLPSECFGLKSTSNYSESYILFSKYENGKILPCQQLFPLFENETNIEKLKSVKSSLVGKQKIFLEKYIKRFYEIKEAKKSNMPFLDTLYSVRVTGNELDLYLNDYVDMHNVELAYSCPVKYFSPMEYVSVVNLP